MYTIWTGERVRLRPFHDEQEYMQMQEDLHLEPNEHWGAWWHPRAKLKKEFADTGNLSAGKRCVFCIERLDTAEAVGFEMCGPITGVNCISGCIGTFLKPEHWHQGFGIEAKQLALCFLFENYPYTRVDAGTVANHKRAAAGIHRAGMKYEGRVRGLHFTDGHYHDLVFYRISREDWEQLPIRKIVKRG